MASALIHPWMYIPAAVLAVLGLAGLYLFLFHGRARGRLRCPRCWYDMAGRTPPATCPECGRTAATLRDLRRTRRRWWGALAALFLVVPLGAVFAKLHAAKVYYAVMPRWRLDDRYESGNTAVRIYGARNPEDFGARVVVTDGGKTVLDEEDFSVTVTGFNYAHKAFIDLNNDGVLECVIERYSGGAHCCWRVYVIELRPAGAAVVADVDTQQGVAVKTAEVSGGEQAVVIPDPSFNYWKTSYVESPKPPVYYLLHDGALRVDLDRMNAAVTVAAADALANESAVVVFSKPTDTPLPVLWSTMLDLLFAGHEPQAWLFFDRSWPAAIPGKAEFLREFKEVLATDSWYQDVLAARAARAAGRPIPPSIVGMSGRAADAANGGR